MKICITKIDFIFLVSILFSFTNCFSSDVFSIQWASKVISFSSQLGLKQFSAEQALGKPSVRENFGLSPCSWTPQRIRNKFGEYLHLGFENPQQVQTIIVNLNNSPNCISNIYLFDEKNNKYLVYNKVVFQYPKDTLGVLFKQLIPKTSYRVSSIRIEFDTRFLNDFLQVDAVSISEFDARNYQISINEIRFTNFYNHKPINLGPKINSNAHELAPIIVADGIRLYFTREGHAANFGRDKRQDIWFANVNEYGEFETPEFLPPPINNDYHNFAFSASPDGNTLLLGNVYLPNGEMQKGISITYFDGKEWSFPKKIEIEGFENFNDRAGYCLSASGTILIMAIENFESYGGLDLYVSFLKSNGKWSKPKNLGMKINTAADESSPFLAYDDETLYFSSAGYPGYGSSDIFMSRRLDSTWENWSEPINLGNIINTPQWDAYFTIPATGDYAYFVSTDKTYGYEDIFKIFLPKELRPKPVVIVKGKVLNKKNNQPLESEISYFSLPEGKLIGIARSNKVDGSFKLVLPGGFKYSFTAQAQGFISINDNLDIRTDIRYQELNLDLFMVPFEIGETVRLNNIFFNYKDYQLLEDSYFELDRLIKILQENPNLEIEIAGHTDNIGSSYYNYNLSLKRAESVANYLIQKGIETRRLVVKGYGEKEPIAPNDTEEGRSLNRRVEFKILKK